MKKISLGVFLLLWVFAMPASADVYMKSRSMNGLSENETWTSGKKQRMVMRVGMAMDMGMGENIKITRADKGVEWEIDTNLKIYQETPLAFEYEPSKEERPLTEEEKAMQAQFMAGFEQADEALDNDACSEAVKLPEARTMAGMTAHGYRSAGCGDGRPTVTLWIADSKSAKAKQIQKETDVFEKAVLEARYSKWPPKEREQAIKMMSALGKAMAQGLMGMPSGGALPKDALVLSMETTGETFDGQMGSGVMIEVIEAEIVPADASRYEIPAGYTKVDNFHALVAQNMMNQFASGDAKLSGIFGGLGEWAAAQEGMEIEPLTAEDRQGMHMLDQFGQAVAGIMQTEMQMQGQWQAPQYSQQSVQYPAQPMSANAPPVEPWQQNLYGQQPPAYPQAMNYPNPQQPAPAGNRPPAHQQRQRAGYPPQQPYPGQQAYPGQQQGGNMQQTMQQIQQTLGAVQGIVSQFRGMSDGFQGGHFGSFQMPNANWAGDGGEYNHYYEDQYEQYDDYYDDSYYDDSYYGY